jgi:hypothetical protein
LTKRVGDGVAGATSGGGVGVEETPGERLRKWKTRREFLHLGELDFEEKGKEAQTGRGLEKVENSDGVREGDKEEDAEKVKDEDVLVDIDDGDEETTGN